MTKVSYCVGCAFEGDKKHSWRAIFKVFVHFQRQDAASVVDAGKENEKAPVEEESTGIQKRNLRERREKTKKPKEEKSRKVRISSDEDEDPNSKAENVEKRSESPEHSTEKTAESPKSTERARHKVCKKKKNLRQRKCPHKNPRSNDCCCC